MVSAGVCFDGKERYWIATNCGEFIGKDEWPPNLPDLPCLGSYAWTLQAISTQAGEHRWAQESSAVDIGPAATRFDQESHIELPVDFRLVWKLVIETSNIR